MLLREMLLVQQKVVHPVATRVPRFYQPQTCSAGELIGWAADLKTVASSKDTVMLGLRTIETFMMTSAKLLESTKDAAEIASADVRTILDNYEFFVGKWSTGDWSGALFDVEQHSQELLVKWISLCLVRKNAERTCPLVKEYSIALDWKHLHVAVLREALSIKALETVAWYMRTKAVKDKYGQTLFHLNHLNHVGPTSDFARKAAAGSRLYIRRYDAWVAEYKHKVAGYWREVEKKKKAAASLRFKVVEAKSKLYQAKDDPAELTSGLARQQHGYAKDDLAVRAAEVQRVVRKIEAGMNELEVRLNATLRAPASITSPLSRDRERALGVLFLMNIPLEIALLAEISLIAQRALASASTADVSALHETAPRAPWRRFNQHSSSAQVNTTQVVVAYPENTDVLRPASRYQSTTCWMKTTAHICVSGTRRANTRGYTVGWTTRTSVR